MTMFTGDARHFASLEFSSSLGLSFDEDSIDWTAVNDRIITAAWELGIKCEDISKFIGLDVNSDDYIKKYAELPKLKTALTVATYLGVTASWILTGKGKPPHRRLRPKGTAVATTQGISDTIDSTVLQGNHAGTLIINNGSQQVSEQKRELNRIFDSLSIRNQTKLLSLAYEIEESEQTS